MSEEETALVHSMCLTWDHSYGIMEPQERDGLFRSMSQVFVHEVKPFVARAILSERTKAAEIAEEYKEFIPGWASDISQAIRKGGKE